MDKQNAGRGANSRRRAANDGGGLPQPTLGRDQDERAQQSESPSAHSDCGRLQQVKRESMHDTILIMYNRLKERERERERDKERAHARYNIDIVMMEKVRQVKREGTHNTKMKHVKLWRLNLSQVVKPSSVICDPPCSCLHVYLHRLTRSHLNCSLRLTGARTHGCLHLVDLAGSERNDKSEAKGGGCA